MIDPTAGTDATDVHQDDSPARWGSAHPPGVRRFLRAGHIRSTVVVGVARAVGRHGAAGAALHAVPRYDRLPARGAVLDPVVMLVLLQR